MRPADARPCASSPLTHEKIENGVIRYCASPTAATRSPTLMSPAAARLPPTSATRAMKMPVSASSAPLCQAWARAARKRRPQRVLAGPAVAVDGGAFGADALQHPQAGDEVGGDAGRERGPLLLGLAAALERLADQVRQVQHRRRAEQHQQAERAVTW